MNPNEREETLLEALLAALGCLIAIPALGAALIMLTAWAGWLP